MAVREQETTRIQLTQVYSHGGWLQGWNLEGNGFLARYAPALIAYAATVYLFATSNQGAIYWKQSRTY
ncbi:hypothetical protein [Kitasatospora sp. NPDC096204]|uniref:hypothetical protein n=1 Tax=Kitasatospora sp. NPDC096204 TaxID=3364094 RepID=UPI0037FA0C7E